MLYNWRYFHLRWLSGTGLNCTGFRHSETNMWRFPNHHINITEAGGGNQTKTHQTDKWTLWNFKRHEIMQQIQDVILSVSVHSSLSWCLDFTKFWLPNTSVSAFKPKTWARRHSYLCFLAIKPAVWEETESDSPDGTRKHAKWNAKLLQEIVVSVVPR